VQASAEVPISRRDITRATLARHLFLFSSLHNSTDTFSLRFLPLSTTHSHTLVSLKMLFSTFATVASLAGLAFAAPATVDRSAGLAKRGDYGYGYGERTVHKVTVGESELSLLVCSALAEVVLTVHPTLRHSDSQARASYAMTQSSSRPRRATSSCEPLLHWIVIL
jgi:hypothetical protein